jgi:AcrR family transcriptional regulator
VALQARAEATRRRILDSAIDLFSELGYGETGLADVLARAGVSKGAFYYHFDSKEAVAVAIIEDFRRRNTETVLEHADRSTPLLDRIIVATFVSAAMIESDQAARIGNQLLQSLGQVSSVASQIYREWTTDFITNLTKAFERIGPRPGVDPAEFAEAMWVGVLGCHLLSAALADDPYTRLSRAWRTLLQATLPDHARRTYDELLDRMSHGLQTVR